MPFPEAVAIERRLLAVYKQWFTDGVYVISGNHDDRVARKTGGQVVMAMLLDSVGVDVSIYTYMYMFMPAVREWVYIAHPYNYSKNAQNLARQIHNVVNAPDGYDNQTGQPITGYGGEPNTAKCHVVIGHTHLQQEGWSEDGLYRCVSLGTLRDPARTAYARRHATKFPKWNQGFGVWLNGKYTALSRRGTVGSGVPTVRSHPSPGRIVRASAVRVRALSLQNAPYRGVFAFAPTHTCSAPETL